MLNFWLVALASLAWLGLMFGIALHGERRPAVLAQHWRHIYALSLAVHCTSWTFYGTVTQAARYGWPLPPTFLGAILFYALAVAFMMRLVRLARETNATSLADLIATRLGKDVRLAATVTLVAALGLIPYIALQLKAVTMSFAMLTSSTQGSDGLQPIWRDSGLYVALAMALFAMLFGTRRASAAEHNRGLVLAMAFESLFKLAAMLALGLFVWLEVRAMPALPPLPTPPSAGGFAPLVLLGALAMFILPHQFHVGVVECRDESHVRTARWLFPLYLILIALPGLPLARAGSALLGDSVPSDMYALALPFAQGHQGLALFAFLGGLSAATGMVVVSTLTLSLMIGNHWFAPGLLRGVWSRRDGGDQRGALLALRRGGIAVIMLFAWAYSRLVTTNDALADVGAVSFSALGTLAPVLAFAVWRPQTPPRAATLGVVAAFLAWAWVILVPTLLSANQLDPIWLREGPFGLAWLSPLNLFGLSGWSPLARAVGVSLFVGTVVTLLAMAWRRDTPYRSLRNLDRQSLWDAGRRFLPRERVDEVLAGAPRVGPVPLPIEAQLERELAAVLGSASARLLLDAARRENADLETVAAIVGEASQDLRFNQQVLGAALQNMSQGISVVDREQRLVAWNRRYVELFGFPDEFLQVGRPIADLTRWALQRMPHRGHDERALERRLAYMRAGTAHLTERVFPDGSIVEIRGNPMPGGGFVATYTDVTASRHAERDLMRANETLEQRVAERTELLETAKREAEHANDAKSRFLTAVGHDLLQPLHAAHLFTDALAQQLPDAHQRDGLRQIRGALDSTSDLLSGLLDMSRLEAGGLVPEPRDFPLAEVLEPLASEFGVLAAEHGLRLRLRPTRAWVHSDPQLLRRILQNFLANAIRYTAQGSVVLGVRREGGRLRVEVLDTGPGIAEQDRQVIFEEFRRGEDAGGQGLGLGLSIADRIACLLQAPLDLRSQPGRGSNFSVSLKRAQTPLQHAAAPTPGLARAGLAGRRVLAVDNDPLALSALRSTLEGWGCDVVAVGEGVAADHAHGEQAADVWLFDYHLDDGDTGVALWQRLSDRFGARPTLILTADQTDVVRRAVLDAELSLLAKPVRPLALKSVLDRMMASVR
ncbi:hybrid sensor histidine kinase/response regulator [Pseudoxanthomonas indica]|uniref:histidine kinase n=1 Tax=Pseudoxanthomonas indica TaxID=428993 RepID=A0A1T5IYE8_9GAMM|nr:PAS-domain containing protein [Pseudoxanthomonas indica]GGD55042.1 hybrid sensor histidine kinase/response regulator [Pseudoxanthomonas indica]SKC44190.1 PAS domain S-box-containing protein [Pseudoxanthomonas indica]